MTVGDMIKELDRDGYTILRGGLSAQKQNDILSVVRDMVTARAAVSERTKSLGRPPKDNYEFFSDYVLAVDRADHDIIKLTFDSCFDTVAGRESFLSSEILQLCGTLFSCDLRRIFLNSNRLRIDPPGPAPYRLGWHQESAYGRSKSPAIQYWCPLLWPSSWENGIIEIAVGSNHLGHYKKFSEGRTTLGSQQFLVPDDIVAQYLVKLVEIEPRDLVIFSCHLIHRSSDPRLQTRMKYSLVGRLTDAGSPLFSPYGN